MSRSSFRAALIGCVVLGLLCGGVTSAAVPRSVRIQGQQFVDVNGRPIVMAGPNVVVKGPPYMPFTNGSTICNDVVNAACESNGTCTSCKTFNQADVNHLKSLGWNAIRLGVVWAGAQPRDEDALDPGFVELLHAVLNLTDSNNIHVMLDNHGDMVGTAGCGNGIPMWVAKKAAPELIGKQPVTDFPYSLFQNINKVDGYSECDGNATAWEEHAGDPNYNLLNRCCLAMNSPNPGGLGYTTISQAQMNYILEAGPGRDDFVRFWRLIAEEVAQHPSAFGAELMNEPMSIRRAVMFETWQATAEAINSVIPDMSVALADVGEAAIVPAWVEKVAPDLDIPKSIQDWIKNSSTVFYAWHWYSNPKTVEEAVANVQQLMHAWDVPSFATEFGDCSAWTATAAANISHLYWHYSSYCDTNAQAFGPRTVPTDTFGGCILGWAGGDSSKCT